MTEEQLESTVTFIAKCVGWVVGVVLYFYILHWFFPALNEAQRAFFAVLIVDLFNALDRIKKAVKTK